MAVGGVNYASPVHVNGFSCMNCSDVSLAAKFIDPAHPQSGPFDRDAATDSSRGGVDPVKLAAIRKQAEAALPQAAHSAAGYGVALPEPGAGFSLTA